MFLWAGRLRSKCGQGALPVKALRNGVFQASLPAFWWVLGLWPHTSPLHLGFSVCTSVSEGRTSLFTGTPVRWDLWPALRQCALTRMGPTPSAMTLVSPFQALEDYLGIGIQIISFKGHSNVDGYPEFPSQASFEK